MKRLFYPAILLTFVGMFFVPAHAYVAPGWIATASAQDAAGGDMAKLRIILKKLRDAMASMKDLDQLEAAGMPKKDVDRMRSAMQSKINQMMSEAMDDIRAL